MKRRKEEQAVSAAPAGKRSVYCIQFDDEKYLLPKPIYVTSGLIGAELEQEMLREVVKQLVEGSGK